MTNNIVKANINKLTNLIKNKYIYILFKKMIFISDRSVGRFCGDSYLNLRSKLFWKFSDNTFFGSKNYYIKQEIELTKILDLLTCSKKTGLDIGCGNGRFTRIIATYFDKVFAYDISSKLINEAILYETKNIQYSKKDLSKHYPNHILADTVFCMGVTSTIISHSDFVSLLENLSSSLDNGGILITKDTLAFKKEKKMNFGLYVAKYRQIDEYILSFDGVGFDLVETVILAENNKDDLINKLFVWKKR